LTRKCIKKQNEINNSKHRDPSPLAKNIPIIQCKIKIPKFKIQNSKIPVTRDIFHKNREISILMMKKSLQICRLLMMRATNLLLCIFVFLLSTHRDPTTSPIKERTGK
jgi:hypothetical protein